MYSIDANSLIDCWNRRYPNDVFPSFWEKIERMIVAKQIIASEIVLDELGRKDDELAKWGKQHKAMFHPLDADVQMRAKAILSKHPNLVNGIGTKVRADPFVIALAQQTGATVITEENSGNLTSPKIPFVCSDLKVPCVNMLRFMRDQKWIWK